MLKNLDKNIINGKTFSIYSIGLMLTLVLVTGISVKAQKKGAGSGETQTIGANITDGGDLTIIKISPIKGGGSDAGPNPVPNAVDANSFYSNVTTFSGSAFANGGAAADPANAANTITRLLADDLNLVRATNIIGYRFNIANLNATAVSARPLIRFYAANGTNGGPGTLLGGNNFNAISFAAGTVTTYQTGTLATAITNTNTRIWAAVTFDNNSGATGATVTQLNNLGQGVFNPIDRGGSSDTVFTSTANGSFTASNPAGSQTNFGGAPLANLGWEIIGSAPPTAANASVAGRVLSNGKGLANALVQLTGTGGTTRTVSTNAFGNFTIDNVESGTTYVVNVSAKKYTFAPQVISVADNISGLTFTAQ